LVILQKIKKIMKIMSIETKQKLSKFVIILVIAIIIVAGITTYLSAKKTRSSLIRLMKRDAISLANIFVEGSSSIYESQVSLIDDLRMRLLVYSRMVESNSSDLSQVPPEMAYTVLVDSSNIIVRDVGVITPQVNDWLGQLDRIIEPLRDGEKKQLFFGLDPELPVSTGPVGFAKWCNGNILVIFSYPPFRKEFGIGFLARQLAETPSVRYIILQNERGILIASKDVYRVVSIDSDPFLQNVLTTSRPDVRFAAFQNERIFELAYPFPRMGKFGGVLRIGLPLSEYKELSTVVVWSIFSNILLALLAIFAIFALGKVISRTTKMRGEHERLIHLRSLGEIVAAVAHEIRNPLNAVSISLQRLDVEFQPTDDTDDYHKIIKSARTQTKNIDDIVREFIAVAGNVSPVKSEVDIQDFLSQICQNFAGLAIAKKIEFIQKINVDGLANIDTDKISRAIWNVLKNALEATSENGTIEFSAEIIGDKSILRIFDSGEKIPADMFDRIFEPFISEKGSGTGIGLFYAYRIINAHEGTITVQNLTDGVEFLINLPLK